MRLLVCGGRDFADRDLLDDTLNVMQPSVVIHGGAKGADTMAGQWAEERGVLVEVYRACWNDLGRAAGAIRNQQMLDEGRPDAVLAFPGGRGTADMVRRAKAAGLPVTTP